MASRAGGEGRRSFVSQPSAATSAGPRAKWYFVTLAVASVVLLVLFLELGAFAPGPAQSTTSSATTSTSFDLLASSVVADAASRAPAGYVLGSSRQINPSESGLASGSYGVFSAEGGDLANMTILVFNGTGPAQTYIESVVSNARNLPGYTDVTSALAGYGHYGICYGYGETDPDGNGAVATGVCTKGNVYILVHLVSPVSLSSAEADLSGFMGAAYQGVG
jgi:hypothetical protein